MSHAQASNQKNNERSREWVLQPQNEYRFELAQNTSIGIKVRSRRDPQPTPTNELAHTSFWMDMPNASEPNSPQG